MNPLSHLPLGQLGDALNRTVKLALDTGEVASLEEAIERFAGYRLQVAVGPNVAASATRQAALLTIVNTARRCFLGGVRVVGCPEAHLLLPWRGCSTLRGAVESLQGECVSQPNSGVPTVHVGDARIVEGEFAVRATFDGWSGGVAVSREAALPEEREFTPSGVLAGALAVSEAFQFVRGKNALAGRRSAALSLWRPERDPWRDAEAAGPQVGWLPSKLWVIGLGHLGQAYLWTLGFLPYAAPGEVELVLQDQDVLQASNDSTSVLTDAQMLGQKKTRAMATWCEARGFQATIVERRFADDFRVQAEEPRVALCGVDNPQARACLQDVGLAEIIEAGLGSVGEEYLNLQVHSFSDAPLTKTARAIWGDGSDGAPVGQIVLAPAYELLKESGGDQCGVTQLAGRAVGASFVGVVASTLVVAELLRMCCGAHRYAVADLSLRTPDRLKVFPRSPGEPRNLGLTRAA